MYVPSNGRTLVRWPRMLYASRYIYVLAIMLDLFFVHGYVQIRNVRTNIQRGSSLIEIIAPVVSKLKFWYLHSLEGVAAIPLCVH